MDSKREYISKKENYEETDMDGAKEVKRWNRRE